LFGTDGVPCSAVPLHTACGERTETLTTIVSSLASSCSSLTASAGIGWGNTGSVIDISGMLVR
jgi:hypothetical protein